MFYFYIIKSFKDQSLYFGSTVDLKNRIREHNNGESRYTKNKIPWKLVYYEAYLTLKQARYREWKLKNSANEYRKLKERILA
jgi:putative endonuclease